MLACFLNPGNLQTASDGMLEPVSEGYLFAFDCQEIIADLDRSVGSTRSIATILPGFSRGADVRRSLEVSKPALARPSTLRASFGRNSMPVKSPSLNRKVLIIHMVSQFASPDGTSRQIGWAVISQ